MKFTKQNLPLIISISVLAALCVYGLVWFFGAYQNFQHNTRNTAALELAESYARQKCKATTLKSQCDDIRTAQSGDSVVSGDKETWEITASTYRDASSRRYFNAAVTVVKYKSGEYKVTSYEDQSVDENARYKNIAHYVYFAAEDKAAAETFVDKMNERPNFNASMELVEYDTGETEWLVYIMTRVHEDEALIIETEISVEAAKLDGLYDGNETEV